MADDKKHISSDKSASITEAFLKHETFLKRFISRFLPRPHDIEDVVQETYLKAYSAEKKHSIHQPKAFLFQVARNTALKQLTKKSNQITGYIEEIDAPEIISDELSIEDHAMAREKLGLFCQSALEMPPRCRRVFLMAKVYGFSYKEISAQLGISASAVEKHVAKGLQICSTYMAKIEQESTDPEVTAATPIKGRGRYSTTPKVRDLL